MKYFKLALASFAFVALTATALFVPDVSVGAISALDEACSQSNSTADNPVCSTPQDDAQGLVRTLVNVLLFVIGALAVVMIIWSGIAYVISAGDAGKVKKAKDTLTYSIVGLIVAFLAFAIVNWVITQL